MRSGSPAEEEGEHGIQPGDNHSLKKNGRDGAEGHHRPAARKEDIREFEDRGRGGNGQDRRRAARFFVAPAHEKQAEGDHHHPGQAWDGDPVEDISDGRFGQSPSRSPDEDPGTAIILPLVHPPILGINAPGHNTGTVLTAVRFSIFYR